MQRKHAILSFWALLWKDSLEKTFIVSHPSINGKIYLMFQKTVIYFSDTQVTACSQLRSTHLEVVNTDLTGLSTAKPRPPIFLSRSMQCHGHSNIHSSLLLSVSRVHCCNYTAKLSSRTQNYFILLPFPSSVWWVPNHTNLNIPLKYQHHHIFRYAQSVFSCRLQEKT